MDEKKLPLKKYLAGDVIFKHGELGYTAYLLKSGRVEISMDVSGNKVKLAELTPEAVFGEIAVLLRGQRRTASATAIESSELLEVDKDSFHAAVDASNPIVKAALNAAAERLQKTTEKVHSAPDTFLGTAEVLGIFAQQGIREVEYFVALRSISEALRVDLGAVEGVVKKMVDAGLVVFAANKHGKKVVRFLKEKDFCKGAKKLYQDIQKG